ncbi:hypothetical protein BST96_14780 [Oceanicoccus sagamiensis]|uniref:Cytochrome c domain-containing protein n=2 Tax=Oceanicoccus sagamiensis TaxID=716816 RepID=A0A1X9NK84_9GAMM|nr:hypothetical protein BST96_14780 [Oceanicoccus sagamiensis]
MKNFDSLAYAEQLTMPTLIIDAEEEELFARDKNGLVLHEAIKDRVETKYVTYPGKHYDMYRGENYRNALRDAQDWFVTHLKGNAEGASLYKEKCALCHSNPQIRAPAFSILKSMSEEKVLLAMTEGKMKQQAASLSDKQRSQLAKYLSTGVQDPRAWETTVACDAGTASKEINAAVTGWGYGLNNHRYQPEALAGLTANDLPELELAWAQGFPGTTEMRSQPVITEDTLYLGVQSSSAIYAFDLASGCLKWVHRGGPVRSALSFARMPESNTPILFYGDANGVVHVVDATDGSEVWAKKIALDDIVITGTPVLHQQKLFVPLSTSEIAKTFNSKYECCKAHGGVVALDIRTGKTLWTYETTAAAKPLGKNAVDTTIWGPSGAPIWTTPAIDAKRNRLYIGTGENYSHPATSTSDAIIALDLDTGKQQWIYQARKDDVYNMACVSYLGFPDGPNCPENYGPDFDFGASVVITQDKNGKDLLLAAQKSGDVYALDPDKNGAVVWQQKLSDGTPVGGVHWGMAVAGQQVFVPVADPDWDIQGWTYKPQPGIAALDITTGAINWRYQAERGCKIDASTYNTTAQRHSEKWPACHFLYGFSGAATAIDGAVLAGSLNGTLYAFAANDGKPLWQFPTNRSFDTLNGVQAHGGALDNAGPAVGHGYLVLQSGYSYIKQMPGNVLLVFKKK